MIDSETAVVYSMTFAMSSEESAHFTISSSQSQGFSWNQDLFASQYQQMCKVVYDGHEDGITSLLERVRSVTRRNSAYHDVFEDDENDDIDSTDSILRRRLSEEILRPRRRSERSISFVSDSKNGNYKKAETIIIDVDTDTSENMYLRSLLKHD